MSRLSMRSSGLALTSLAMLAVTASCGTPQQTAPAGEAAGESMSGSRTAESGGPPDARREDIVDTLFGVSVPDPYRWLEDAASPEVQTWMDAEDAWARQWLTREGADMRESLLSRFRELYYVDTVSPPYRRGERYFYSRSHADREKDVYYYRQGEDGEEIVLLDPNSMSTEERNITIDTIFPDEEGVRFAYSMSENAADEASLVVVDISSGETLEVLEGAKYASPQWTPDGAAFYYTFLPPAGDTPVDQRPGLAEIRYHVVGTPQSDDVLIQEATGDPTIFVSPYLSRDGRWLLTYRQLGWSATEVTIRDLQSENPQPVAMVEGRDALFSVTPHEEWLYIHTNDGAPRYRLWRVPASANADELHMDHWQPVVAEDAEAVLEGVQILNDHLVLTYLRNAASEIRIATLDGTRVRTVELPAIGYSGGFVGHPDDDTAYFSFQNFVTPTEIYRTQVSTGETSLWTRVELPIDATPYEVEQVWYPSVDGTEISMFIVRRSDAPRDGSSPTLLYGYGGFNVSLLPWFRASIYPWLEAGGTYAVANLRGGGEYGEAWHQAGMLGNKQNVFDDFIAAAEYLIENGYTASDRLAISGGSNGGLLVGAAMTQRPDLFRAVVCAVPLLDMVRYHLFGSGQTWTREYGSAENEGDFSGLHTYSPYHRVQPGTAYPALLMMSADSDDRVDPMHARKFVALVREHNTAVYPVLLRIERNAGHGGADMTSQAVEYSADQFTFLMRELGLQYP